jgi:predicted transport protein
MPLFKIADDKLVSLRAQNFQSEKDLQRLFEANLETIFGCRFVASEFQTGERHGGRIDTLALSEDGNPVLIEYKKEASSDLLNQSLFYLSWIQDHRGDFKVAAMKALGAGVDVDWSDIRVICIAPNYKKYDLHAVRMMGANIELWQYHRFEDGSLYLQESFRKDTGSVPSAESAGASLSDAGQKNPVMIEAGKKAALTRATGIYTIDEHERKANGAGVGELFTSLREQVIALSDAIEEVPKKFYVAFKVAKNFLCVEVRQGKLLMFLKLDPSTLDRFPENGRDVSAVGHYGTGDLELTVRNVGELDAAMPFVAKALDAVGE